MKSRELHIKMLSKKGRAEYDAKRAPIWDECQTKRASIWAEYEAECALIWAAIYIADAV